MAESGCTCDDPDLVAAKDQNMSLPFVSGNPFSRFCRTCGRRYFCAKKFWEKATNRFIIPEGEDEPIPAEDYEDYFECPADGCSHPHIGTPDECGSCGAEYDWS